MPRIRPPRALARFLVALVAVTVIAPVLDVLPAAAAPVAPTAPGPSAAPTVWLCRPGMPDDPCATSLATTVTTPRGAVERTTTPTIPARPKLDCFYVYPTVSDQHTPNADLTVDPTERSIALYQAARFSSVCRVYAPMYRQLTISAIQGSTTTAEQLLAYDDVLDAWGTYLRQYNHGRGVVLIGHSQGSFMLEKLIAAEIDPHPSVRKLLVSALLMGGNVTVKRGSGVGGTFRHVPACRSDDQTGCVIAYSTFDAPPPADSLFGRTTAKGDEVLCTDPAALQGGTGLLDPILPTTPFAPGSSIAIGISLLKFTLPQVTTPWVSLPGAYDSRCVDRGGADVLEITPRGGAPDLHYSPTPGWGLHLVDVNVALGNLVGIVHDESDAWKG